MPSLIEIRLAVFATMSDIAQRPFGRTALMKLCYFLQALKEVPLGYDFSLYSYGPFDSQVLSDLHTAETIGVLSTEIEHYPGGYGYLISPAGGARPVKDQAKNFLTKYSPEIEWTVQTFAHRSASDLELISTIIFTFQENPRKDDVTLIPLVRAVKPHFSVSQVENQIRWLRENNLLLQSH